MLLQSAGEPGGLESFGFRLSDHRGAEMNVLRGLVVGAVAACGCSGGSSAGPAAANGAVPMGQTPASVTTARNTGASNSGVASVVTMNLQSFDVPPNTEAWKCQDFKTPFGNQQVDVIQWESQMTPGSHHMTLFETPNANDGPLTDCPNGPTNGDTLYAFGSQISKAVATYPDGVGETIPTGMGFTINSHYVNTTAESIHAEVMVKISVAAAGVVTQHAGAWEGLLYSISVPPTQGKPVTVGSTCKLPQDMTVFAIAGHMHEHGTNFIAKSGGQVLARTDEVASVPTVFSPPLQFKKGDDITWSCDYTNATGQTLVYGPSALTNVMCNTIVAFYPVMDLNNPILPCVQ